MIKHSAEYSKAIVADSRRQAAKAIFDLSDPDMVVTSVKSNSESKYSKLLQTTSRGLDETSEKIATLEDKRWLLDGSWNIAPDNPADTVGQYGWWSKVVSGDDAAFQEPYPYLEQEIKDTEVLQGITLQFSQHAYNGYPVDFRVEIYAGAQLAESKDFTNNTELKIYYTGFTVNFPTKLRLIIKKWSGSSRKARVIRFLAGFYEEWSGDIIKNVDIVTESTFSGLSLPYSTCTLEVFNESNRFDPYAPGSLFKSIEDRQSIKASIGLRLPSGEMEWIPAGTYFQQSGGWSILPLTVQFKLLDIIGMLSQRRFVVPSVLPTTLSGWIESIMASLGTNFRKMYIVDNEIGSAPLNAAVESVSGSFCGDLLRFACMATNSWPHQDFKTGKLIVSKIAHVEGNSITLDNMPSYAVMSENDAVADITFAIDGAKEITFPGTNTDSDVSISVSNPFVHDERQARVAFASCMYEYGGKKFDAKSRGNPTSETGDIMSIQTQFNTQISARLKKQQLKLDVGAMFDLPSELVQSPNDSVYKNKQILTGSGLWAAPSGVQSAKITLIQGGTGGTGGGGGIMTGDNARDQQTNGGTPGPGGKVYITEISVNQGQQLPYNCGKGGAGGAGGAPRKDGTPGADGGETTFGQFTSANGKRYPVGIMDVSTGSVFASTGTKMDDLFGCGGLGGERGEDGYQYVSEPSDGTRSTVIAKYPSSGLKGGDGKEGCVIVEW